MVLTREFRRKGTPSMHPVYSGSGFKVISSIFIVRTPVVLYPITEYGSIRPALSQKGFGVLRLRVWPSNQTLRAEQDMQTTPCLPWDATT